MAVGGTILQNELAKHLPEEFTSRVASATDAVNAIPLFSSLPQQELNLVREAFATSLSTVWYVMCGIAGLGFLVSLLMRHYQLHTSVDEDWGMEERKKDDETAGNSGQVE